MPDCRLVVWILLTGCALMTGSSWWCECVRYPAFLRWAPEEFHHRHNWHTFEIGIVVIPGMIMQIAGAAALFLYPQVPWWLRVVHVVLTLASIGPTLLISGPLHGRLSRVRDEAAIRRLIRANLPRTLAWTAQLVACVPLFFFVAS